MDSWRFTSCGVTREVTVVDTGRTGVQRYAVERGTAQFPGACPEDAVVQYTRCAGFLDLREIVPPGAPTRDEIRRERDAWAHRAEQAEAQAASLAARVAALEEILAGRTTPPTDAEIEAHDGAWLCVFEGRPCISEHASGTRYLRGSGARSWIAFRDGIPCAWPALEAPRG